MSVVNISHAFIACLWGNNENDFVYRSLERDLMEEQDIIEQEGYFWREFVEKKVEPPLVGNRIWCLPASAVTAAMLISRSRKSRLQR